MQGVPWCVTMYISHYCRNHFNIIFAFSTVHMIYLKLQHNVFCAPYLSSFFSLYRCSRLQSYSIKVALRMIKLMSSHTYLKSLKSKVVINSISWRISPSSKILMTAQQTILLIPISLTAFVFKNQYNVNGSFVFNMFLSGSNY